MPTSHEEGLMMALIYQPAATVQARLLDLELTRTDLLVHMFQIKSKYNVLIKGKQTTSCYVVGN